MSEIKSIIKIKSAIRSSFANNKYATVLNNGDENNGVILLKLLRKDNKSRLLGRSINEHGRYDWNDILVHDDIWQDESLITDRIKKEISFDPDLWVLEIETEEYWNPLESEPL